MLLNIPGRLLLPPALVRLHVGNNLAPWLRCLACADQWRRLRGSVAWEERAASCLGAMCQSSGIRAVAWVPVAPQLLPGRVGHEGGIE